MSNLYFFEDLEYVTQIEIAKHIAAFTNSTEGADANIVPISFEYVMQNEEALVALINKTEFAGYISFAEKIIGDEWGYRKIGSLVVPAAFRGQGFASQLVCKAREQAIDTWDIPFAFCNSASQPIFESAGFEPALHGELPPAAQSKYANTPMVYPLHKFIHLGP